MPMNPLPLPAFQDNYIWCLAVDGSALVVDPGDAAVVESWLQAQGLSLKAILVTHHHADHTGGVSRLKTGHQPRVYGPDEDIPGLDVVLRGGERINLGVFGTANVMAVPGHTRGHIAFHFPDEALLFCGDTLFSAGCGRLFEGTAAEMFESLQRIAALPDNTRVCCTHEYTLANLRFAAAVEPGNPELADREREARELRRIGQPSLPSYLGRERSYNPFLRCSAEAVVRAASRHAGISRAPGLEVFTALRTWKDSF